MTSLKYREFRYVTLNDKVLFDITYVCSTCGYYQGFIPDIPLGLVVEKIGQLFISKECTMCDGGEFNWPSFLVFNKTINQPFNAICFRIMYDGHYLREAFENPCSVNICQCSKNENYLVISYSQQFPFICATCSKLFLYDLMAQRKDLAYGFLRSIQVNCFRDFSGKLIELPG